MPSANNTQYYHLSQFLDSDKPTWRGDYNSDMAKIDEGVHLASDAAGIAHTAAMEAKEVCDEMEATVAACDQAVESISTRVSTAEGNIATNTQSINSLNTREAGHYAELRSSLTTANESTQARFQSYLTKGEAATLYSPISASSSPHVVILGSPRTGQWASAFSDITESTVHPYTATGASIANLATVASNAVADTAYSHSLVDWIIIGGGEADVEGQTEIDAETLNSTLASLVASFPNASILIVPFCIFNSSSIKSEAFRSSLYNRVNELENVIIKYGFHCATDSYTWLMKSTNYYANGALTTIGAQEFAGQVYRYMTGEPTRPHYFVQKIGTGGSSANGLVRLEAYVDGALCTLRWVYSHNASRIEANSWLYTLGPAITPNETFFTQAYLPSAQAERFMRIQSDGQVYMIGSVTTPGAGYSYMDLTYRTI